MAASQPIHPFGDTAFSESDLAAVDAVRRFNRFYTRQLGMLQEAQFKSPFSLSEARVIHELSQCESATAAQLAQELNLDGGYLSRILRGFEERAIIRRSPAPYDARQQLVELTDLGHDYHDGMVATAREQVHALLKTLAGGECDRLLEAMATVESLLGGRKPEPFCVIRPHRIGDMGWVVQRHGELYSTEYNWDWTFEGLVAGIVGEFVRNYDHARERCWIAELDGRRVGSVFLVRHPEREGVAKLRLLIVEPWARGLGIGKRLVQEALRFARETGYRAVTLWTQSMLTSACGLYGRAGFRLVDEEPHHSFGHDLVGQTWELDL